MCPGCAVTTSAHSHLLSHRTPVLTPRVRRLSHEVLHADLALGQQPEDIASAPSEAVRPGPWEDRRSDWRKRPARTTTSKLRALREPSFGWKDGREKGPNRSPTATEEKGGDGRSVVRRPMVADHVLTFSWYFFWWEKTERLPVTRTALKTRRSSDGNYGVFARLRCATWSLLRRQRPVLPTQP